MDKVMVIGAGRGQIPIINLFHKYGYSVIVVSVKGNYPGFEIADEVLYADIRDYEVILDCARKNNIKACLTDQLDEAVWTVAYITEKLGLKGITTEVAEKFTNKYIMRREAKKIGVAVPKSILIQSENDKEEIKKLKFPIMIKPVDSSASYGIFKIKNLSEFQEKYPISKNKSKKGLVIAEEFIQGQEYVVDAFTQNYKVTNLIVGHREYFDIPETFIPSATVFRDSISASDKIETKLKDANEKLIKGFGLSFGITHAEYIYNEESDTVYLVEIAGRGGGVFISSDLIPLACGVNANDLLVRDVLNLPIDTPIKLKNGASAYFCYLTPMGKISKINGIDAVSNEKGVAKAFFDNIEIGMDCKSICDKSSRKGPILVYGKTKQDCFTIINRVKDLLDVKVFDGNTVKDIIWS